MFKPNKSIVITLCFILISLFTLSSCSEKEEIDLAAIVGNKEITMEMLTGVSALSLYIESGNDLSTLSADEQLVSKNQVLTYICIDKELARTYFEEKNINVIDENAKTQIASSIDALYANNENLEADFSTIGVKKEHLEYYYETEILITALREDLAENEPPTEDEIYSYYEENQNYYVSPGTVTASHILIIDPDHTDEKRDEIADILTLARRGEDFAALAEMYSEDSATASDGGNVGTFGQDGTMLAEFEIAAFALEEGEISDIVETENGYHIIKVTEKSADTPLPIEEIRDEIINAVNSEKVETLLAQLKETTEIKYYVELDEATGEPRVMPKDPEGASEEQADDAFDDSNS